MSHDVETLLRRALHAEADAAVPWGDPSGADPWPRVDEAHRRSRARRRAGVAGALVAVLALGGVVATRLDGGTPPPPAGGTRQDTWEDLDDGRTRGEPVDAALRAAVADALRRPCCGRAGPEPYAYTGDPAGIRFLWAGDLGRHRTALVRATFTGVDSGSRRDMLAWVGEKPDGGRFEAIRTVVPGDAVASTTYVTDGGEVRLLAVVRRGAAVDVSQARINAYDGVVLREWTPAPVTDGVADVAVDGLTDEPPTELRVRYPGSARAYTGPEGFRTPTTGKVTEADVDRALAGARGDARPAGVRADVRSSLEMLTARLASDPEHTSPRVLWAGADVPGHAVVALSGGFEGQGGVLLVRGLGGDGGIDWEWWTTRPAERPATDRLPYAWRVGVPYLGPTTTAHVVGWLTPEGAGDDVVVTVNGTPRQVATRHGLGTVEVAPRDRVTVSYTLPNGARYELPLEAGDVQRPFDPARYDLFPPGDAGENVECEAAPADQVLQCESARR